MKNLHYLLLGVVASTAISSAEAAPLIQNGSFEEPARPAYAFLYDPDHTLTGWISTSPFNFNSGFADASQFPGIANSGNQGVFFGPAVDLNYLEQTFDTEINKTYTLTFWLANSLLDPTLAGQGEYFAASVDDFATTLVEVIPTSSFGYTFFSANFTASAASTTLKFASYREFDYWYLDDVSVVPEPGTFMLFGIGLAGLGLGGKRNKAQVS